MKRFLLFLEISYKLKLTCSVDQHFKILPREIEYRSHCLHVTGTMSLKSQWSYPVSLFSFLPYFLHVFQPVPIHSSQFVRQQAVAIAVLVQFPEKISTLQKTLSKIFRFGTHQIWLSIAEFWRGNQATPSCVLAQMIFRDYLVLVYMSNLQKAVERCSNTTKQTERAWEKDARIRKIWLVELLQLIIDVFPNKVMLLFEVN